MAQIKGRFDYWPRPSMAFEFGFLMILFHFWGIFLQFFFFLIFKFGANFLDWPKSRGGPNGANFEFFLIGASEIRRRRRRRRRRRE